MSYSKDVCKLFARDVFAVMVKQQQHAGGGTSRRITDVMTLLCWSGVTLSYGQSVGHRSNIIILKQNRGLGNYPRHTVPSKCQLWIFTFIKICGWGYKGISWILIRTRCIVWKGFTDPPITLTLEECSLCLCTWQEMIAGDYVFCFKHSRSQCRVRKFMLSSGQTDMEHPKSVKTF